MIRKLPLAKVCSGDIRLQDAQQEISTNWIESYRKRIGEPPALEAPRAAS